MKLIMDYTTVYDKSGGICIVKVTGQHKRPQDSLVLQQLARKMGEESRCQKFLFDMRHADIIGDAIDTYEAGKVPGDLDHTQLSQKVALVYSGDLSKHKFLEDVAVNRGYQLRVFDNLEKAFEWLSLK